MAADTGHGVSLTFSGVTYNLKTLTPPAQELTEHTELPHVGLAVGAIIPIHAGELRRYLPMSVTFEVDPTNATFAKKLDGSTVSTTITWPVSVAGNTAASYAFDAVLETITPGELTTGVAQECAMTMKPLTDVTQTAEVTP